MIYWNGCSFVQGMEVEKIRDQFVSLVSEEFNQDWIRHSKVGGSNDRIHRCVIDDFCNSSEGVLGAPGPTNNRTSNIISYAPEGHKADLVIILWSGINRMEYLNSITNTWRQSAWIRHRMAPSYPFQLSNDSSIHYHPDMTRSMHSALEGYCKKVRFGTANLLESLNYMISVKYILESKGIPYLFYNLSDGQINPVKETIDNKRLEGANITWENQQLNWAQYCKELPHLEEEGFYDMCKRNNVPFGPKDHPLEEGNRLMANRIIKDIYDKNLDKVFSKEN